MNYDVETIWLPLLTGKVDEEEAVVVLCTDFNEDFVIVLW